MSIEGHIIVEIRQGTPAKDNDNLIGITSNRRTDIANFLTGKSAADAISILPVIFNICGQAHAQAAQKAFGQYHSDSDLIVLCENAREHLVRIYTGWSLDEKPILDQFQFGEIIGLVSRMEIALEKDRADIKQISKTINDYLRNNIFSSLPQDWLDMTTDEELAIWAEQTTSVAGTFIQNIYQKNWQSIGSIEPDFLPDISAVNLSDKMHQTGVISFIALPQWAGRCYETGTLARNNDHPLIAALAQKYGYGLLTRQIARLIDLAKIPSDIENHTEGPQVQKNVSGFGQVETARGRLTHSVVLDSNVISDYKILAPTEWNFHPDGVLFKSLQNLPASDEVEIKSMARMIIEAIDPCVAFNVRVH